MGKRRGKGEGSITQLPDGRWQARIDLGYVDGRRKRKAFYGKTREEAARKLTRALADHQKGLPLPDERLTVAQFLTEWLDNTARPSVRPRTFVRYRELVALHALPALGRRRLARLTPQDLQALYADRIAAGLSPRTVGHLHRVLHRAFQDAFRWGLLGRNPCDAVNPPKVTKPELRALTPEEARRFLAAVAGHRLEALFTLALTTGMRQGELLGLKWQDVDLETGVVRVRRALQRLRHVGFVEVEPKSATSRRAVRLLPLAATALRRHRARQLEERLQAGAMWEERDLVFCTEHGRPLTHTTVLRAFWRLLAQAELPRIRFHDLRHSTATLLLAQGTHPKIVQELLGHSSISLTLDTYSHVLPHLQLEATARLQHLLEG